MAHCSSLTQSRMSPKLPPQMLWPRVQSKCVREAGTKVSIDTFSNCFIHKKATNTSTRPVSGNLTSRRRSTRNSKNLANLTRTHASLSTSKPAVNAVPIAVMDAANWVKLHMEHVICAVNTRMAPFKSIQPSAITNYSNAYLLVHSVDSLCVIFIINPANTMPMPIQPPMPKVPSKKM